MSTMPLDPPVSVPRNVPVRALFLVALGLILSGCVQLGPKLVQAGRNDYNQVLAQTNDEEMLLNLVRLRYGDSPVFMDVTSVSTSFNWQQGLDAQAFQYEPDSVDSNVGVRGNLNYSESPTITYTPLGGADFVRSVLTPIRLESLILLAHSGWSVDRLLRVMVSRMNGLSNAFQASGPTPPTAPPFEEFQRAAQALRALQTQDLVTSGYRSANDANGFALRIEPEAIGSAALAELSALTGLRRSGGVIALDNNARRQRSDGLGLELRSLVGVMFFLSHGVDVPQRDIEAGRVMVTRRASGEPFDWERVVGDLLDVKSQRQPPADATIAVEYRGTWFYVDDTDIQSKYTFMLLGQLGALQSGNIERVAPVLTLPVGGR
jgi:hypothetical protein